MNLDPKVPPITSLKMNKPISIAITDDHPMILSGLKTILEKDQQFEVQATYKTIAETYSGLEKAQPQILLLDINLTDGSGNDACKVLHKTYPNLIIVAISNFEETSFVRSILKQGAKGYIAKYTESEELLNALSLILKGELYLSPSIKTKILEESLGKRDTSFIPRLTRREQEVLELIVKEFTTEEIAQKLFVTTKAIEAHRSNLIQKLCVRNTAGLVKIAIEKGLV